MRTQGCREKIDWVRANCGGNMSAEAVEKVKKASEFVRKKAPYLEMVATDVVNELRAIEDPIIQGKVLSMAKEAIETKRDPRTGKAMKHGLSRPMALWLIEYAKTGKRPVVVKTRKQFELNKENLELLKIMRDGGLAICKQRGLIDTAYALNNFYEKLVKGAL